MHPVPYIALDDGEKVTPIPEPANMAGSIQEPIVPVDTNMAQKSPVGHVGRSKHRGSGGGNGAGRTTQVPVSRADGNEARQPRRSNRKQLAATCIIYS